MMSLELSQSSCLGKLGDNTWDPPHPSHVPHPGKVPHCAAVALLARASLLSFQASGGEWELGTDTNPVRP